MSSRKTYIIAEAGVNHNGSLQLAEQLIVAAAEAGADAIKFQTFRTELLVTTSAPKAEYQQKASTGQSETQYDMLKRLELTQEAHLLLLAQCRQKNIVFLSTPFDSQSLQFLNAVVDLPCIKLSSGDITNAPFLLEIAQTGKPVIVSTGMSLLSEIEMALWVLAYGYTHKQQPPNIAACRDAYISASGQAALRDKVTLLHCTTEYPAPFDEVNLNAMDTLRAAFGLPVGYSDHTMGLAIPIAAAARGAVVIEKHFTLDRSLPGPDHKASLEPSDLKLLVRSIREVETALGSGLKTPSLSEQKNSLVARKSLVACTCIAAGEQFSQHNLTVKRPGNGQSPMDYWQLLGRKAQRDYRENELIERE